LKLLLLVLVTISLAGCEVATPPGSPVQSIRARLGLKSYRITMTTMKGKKVEQAVKLSAGWEMVIKTFRDTGWTIQDIPKKTSFHFLDKQPKLVFAQPITGVYLKRNVELINPTPDELTRIAKRHTAVESQDFEGHPCWILKTVQKDQDCTFLLDKKWGIVRQWKSKTFQATMRYDQINAVLDSEFALPKGAKVKDLFASFRKLHGLPPKRIEQK